VAIGATFVYVDDLIRQRLLSETGEVINSLARRFRCVRTPDRSRPFTLFGAGEMTHLMLRSVGFQSRWRIVGVVDSTMSKIGTQIGTVVIDDPKSLLASEGDILISASQGVIDILQEIRRLGISQDRLIRDLII
jgi:FlaA1/EpsC-like NDP-sugar epimerase